MSDSARLSPGLSNDLFVWAPIRWVCLLPHHKRVAVLGIGLAILFAPALFLVATFEFLILSGDLALNEISLFEFFELYLIDLLLFVVLGYGVYRLTFWLIQNRLPKALDAIDETEADGVADEAKTTRAVSKDQA